MNAPAKNSTFEAGTLRANDAELLKFARAVCTHAKLAFQGWDDSGLLQLSGLDASNPESGMLSLGRFNFDEPEKLAGMAKGASHRGYNVYLEGRTVPRHFKGQQRGEATDTVGVFALVEDVDADKGFAPDATFEPSMVVQSSKGNSHRWVFLKKAVSQETGKQLGDRLRLIGCDKDTGVPTQPYRFAGTVYWLTETKRGRGKTESVTKVLSTGGPTYDTGDLALILPEPASWSQKGDGAKLTNADLKCDEDVEALLARCPKHLREALDLSADEVPGGDRSKHWYRTTGMLKKAGFTAGEALALWVHHPHSAAEKYTAGDRLEAKLLQDWPSLEAPLDASQHFEEPPVATDRALEPTSIEHADWKKYLLTSSGKDKRPHCVIANAIVPLEFATEWRGVIGLDLFRNRTMMLRRTPWDREEGRFAPRPWCDADDVRTAVWMQEEGVLLNEKMVRTAVETVAAKNAFDPVIDYLTSMEHDGVARVETWLTRYVGADDTPLMRAFGLKFMVGAVSRAMRPGQKLDTMLILEGPQGARKSTVADILGGEFFSDDIAEIGSKDAALSVGYAWITELSELGAMSRSEEAKTKAFLSRRVDRFRPPYGHRIIEVPRRSVFIGTTNDDSYLRDATGGRRFWPVTVGEIDHKALARDRDQLWAEAVKMFKAGATWWLDDERLIDTAREEQASRYAGDVWDDNVAAYVEDKPCVSIAEVAEIALCIPRGRRARSDDMRISKILKSMGYARYQDRSGGRAVWRYRRTA